MKESSFDKDVVKGYISVMDNNTLISKEKREQLESFDLALAILRQPRLSARRKREAELLLLRARQIALEEIPYNHRRICDVR